MATFWRATQAILKVAEAQSGALKLLKDAKADEAVLKLKSYEAMVGVANGQSTKIIVPSDMQNLVTNGSVFAESLEKAKK